MDAKYEYVPVIYRVFGHFMFDLDLLKKKIRAKKIFEKRHVKKKKAIRIHKKIEGHVIHWYI